MNMLRASAVVLVGASLVLSLLDSPAEAEHKTVRLSGFDEVPVVITGATGLLRVFINSGDGTIGYLLSYDDVGSSVLAAHIHLGQQHTTGGIVAFLCTNGAPPAGVPVPPACPTPSGTVSGTLTANDVLPFPAQGIEDQDIAGLIEALREGVAYVNVHSSISPSGVIRGQFFGKH